MYHSYVNIIVLFKKKKKIAQKYTIVLLITFTFH
jgi:hypothetical protein